MFRRVATWWNERNPADSIVRIEAVKYRWDFANDVDASPEVDRFAVTLDWCRASVAAAANRRAPR